MSTHPNAMLLCILTPDDLARKTARAIPTDEDYGDGSWEVKIGENSYSMRVMETDYDEDSQISAPEGSIVLHYLFTYGYGETVTIGELETLAEDLRAWAEKTCAEHHCSYQIRVGANYW